MNAPATRPAAQIIGYADPLSTRAARAARLRAVLFVLPLLLVATLPLRALDVPFLSGRVVDQAGMLRASTVADLEQRLKAYEDSTGNQIAVLVIATLDGESLEDYSMRVVETWKLGKKGTDNGVLLLVARDDRKLRIEVGYGLEASLTDALCSYIINSVITPRFKDGDMDAGILNGVDAIMQGADGTLAVSESSSSSGDNMSVTEALLFSAFWFSIVGLFTLFAIISDGCSGWFLYAFLIPFYIGGSFVLSMGIGDIALALIPIYIIGLPILRWLFLKSPYSAALKKKLKYSSTGARTSIMGMTFTSSGSSSGSGGGWSSGGGGFSGGGGSFGGGGSSGSW
jgi:uncharacterized protein